MTLTAEQIADGWIEHDGGQCPVTEGVVVDDIMLRCGIEMGALMGDIHPSNWPHGGGQFDIIAYRKGPTS